VPIPVRVEALVDPFMELRADRDVAVGLDLEAGELVSLSVDPDVPAPEGMADSAWAGLVQMAGMMFSMMGDGLFDTLGEHVGKISADLGPDVGEMMADLGVATGPASVSVSSGLMSFALPATDEVVGTAEPADNTADLFIDAVGAMSTRAAACRMARPGSVIVHVGLLPGHEGLDVRKLTLQEITVLGSYCYTPQDFRHTVGALSAGRLGGLGWFEERALQDGKAAFADIDTGTAQAAKIVLRP
jgi:hypothetical protein